MASGDTPSVPISVSGVNLVASSGPVGVMNVPSLSSAGLVFSSGFAFSSEYGTIGSGSIGGYQYVRNRCFRCNKELVVSRDSYISMVALSGRLRGAFWCYDCAGFEIGIGFRKKEEWIRDIATPFSSGTPWEVVADYIKEFGRAEEQKNADFIINLCKEENKDENNG